MITDYVGNKLSIGDVLIIAGGSVFREYQFLGFTRNGTAKCKSVTFKRKRNKETNQYELIYPIQYFHKNLNYINKTKAMQNGTN